MVFGGRKWFVGFKLNYFPVFHSLFVLRDFTNSFVFVSPNFDKMPFLFLFACSFPSSGRTQKEQ